MKVKLGDLTKIKTGKLDANASSEDGQYPFFTCSREPLKISNYSYDCECVLVAGNGDLNVSIITENLMLINVRTLLRIIAVDNYICHIFTILWKAILKSLEDKLLVE